MVNGKSVKLLHSERERERVRVREKRQVVIKLYFLGNIIQILTYTVFKLKSYKRKPN